MTDNHETKIEQQEGIATVRLHAHIAQQADMAVAQIAKTSNKTHRIEYTELAEEGLRKGRANFVNRLRSAIKTRLDLRERGLSKRLVFEPREDRIIVMIEDPKSLAEQDAKLASERQDVPQSDRQQEVPEGGPNPADAA